MDDDFLALLRDIREKLSECLENSPDPVPESYVILIHGWIAEMVAKDPAVARWRIPPEVWQTDQFGRKYVPGHVYRLKVGRALDYIDAKRYRPMGFVGRKAS